MAALVAYVAIVAVGAALLLVCVWVATSLPRYIGVGAGVAALVGAAVLCVGIARFGWLRE